MPDAPDLPEPPEGPLPPGTGRQVWSRRPATDAEARALASGLRLRLLRLALHEPLTNAELADRLGRNPASVLHHVRALVATGFLVPQQARTGRRGAREVPYLASGKSFYLESPVPSPALLQVFLDELAAVPEVDVQATRLGLRLSSADLEEFRTRLSRLLDEYAARPTAPDGEPWSVLVALHPEHPAPRPPPAAGRPGDRQHHVAE